MHSPTNDPEQGIQRMKRENDSLINRIGITIVSAGMLWVLGCHSASTTSSTAAQTTPIASTESAPGQPMFDTPDAAVQALVAAASAQDRAALRKLFGPEADEMSSGDPVADANDIKNFAAHASAGTRVEEITPDTAQLY